MLYLSQLKLNPRSREAHADLADCRCLHRRVLHAFPDREDISAAREHFGVLFRLERADRGARLLVQSREWPDWSRLPAAYLSERSAMVKRVDELYERILPGHELRFRLRANPTKRVSERATELKNPRFVGKRVDLRGEAEQLQWLARKGEAAGFVVLRADIAGRGAATRTAEEGSGGSTAVPDVRASGSASKVIRYSSGRAIDLAFGSVLFEGRLRVTDAELFRRALEEGIGSGKAFGFGLLSVAPVQPVAV